MPRLHLVLEFRHYLLFFFIEIVYLNGVCELSHTVYIIHPAIVCVEVSTE